MGDIYAYVRVSSLDQNEDRQMDNFIYSAPVK